MSSDNLPHDYTKERARAVYRREEYTRWLIQSRDSDQHLPLFHVDMIARRGSYLIFHFGYEDERSWPLGWSIIPTDPNRTWWRPMLDMVRDYYLGSKFYVG